MISVTENWTSTTRLLDSDWLKLSWPIQRLKAEYCGVQTCKYTYDNVALRFHSMDTVGGRTKRLAQPIGSLCHQQRVRVCQTHTAGGGAITGHVRGKGEIMTLQELMDVFGAVITGGLIFVCLMLVASYFRKD